jgi:hypothetical protein
MKNNSWKKDYLVIIHSDYDNTWRDMTKPCTFKQAIHFVCHKNFKPSMDKGTIRIVTLAEFATLPQNEVIA